MRPTHMKLPNWENFEHDMYSSVMEMVGEYSTDFVVYKNIKKLEQAYCYIIII